MKRKRAILLEEARKSVSDRGAGRVMPLVKAFETLLIIPKSSDCMEKEEQELEKKPRRESNGNCLDCVNLPRFRLITKQL